MSCRAMGYGLEQALMRLVLDDQKLPPRVLGRFVRTDRNAPSARLFADSGFEQISETDWQLSNHAMAPSVPSWFAVEARS